MIILTFSDPEEYIIEKIMNAFSEDYEVNDSCITEMPILLFEKLQIDPGKRQVISCGNEVKLTTREFDILYTLARYRGQVLTAGQIYRIITGEEAVRNHHGIESGIYSIRKKLGHDIIENIRGYGYRFSGN